MSSVGIKMILIQSEDSQQRYRFVIGRFDADFNISAEEFLTREEQAYVQSLTSSKRISEFMQTRYILKNTLSQEMNLPLSQIQFSIKGEGKPVLVDETSGWDFNLSHSHDLFAIAWSQQGEIGIDIERIRETASVVALARRFFSSVEAKLIEEERDLEKQGLLFTRLWSAKEALVKAVASGVFKSAGGIELNAQGRIEKLPEDLGDLHRWDLQYIEAIPGYVCSVAYRARIS